MLYDGLMMWNGESKDDGCESGEWLSSASVASLGLALNLQRINSRKYSKYGKTLASDRSPVGDNANYSLISGLFLTNFSPFLGHFYENLYSLHLLLRGCQGCQGLQLAILLAIAFAQRSLAKPRPQSRLS